MGMARSNHLHHYIHHQNSFDDHLTSMSVSPRRRYDNFDTCGDDDDNDSDDNDDDNDDDDDDDNDNDDDDDNDDEILGPHHANQADELVAVLQA